MKFENVKYMLTSKIESLEKAIKIEKVYLEKSRTKLSNAFVSLDELKLALKIIEEQN